MGAIADLLRLPGVVAAGEYAGHGDSCDYRGHLDREQARMAAMMCRATSMGVNMESELMQGLCPQHCGLLPVQGWTMTGPNYTVCVFGRLFCFLANGAGHLNEVMAAMHGMAWETNAPQPGDESKEDLGHA